MTSIVTYIINLKTSAVRKKYMEELLSPYHFLNLNFIEAVDGRTYKEEELALIFDYNKCFKHQGRNLNKGEIGCVLSHFKCYKTLLASTLPYALILEDDISLIKDFSELQKYDLDKILKTDRPTILLLSGDYWFFKKSPVVSCFDAIGAYAYFINKVAASLIIEKGKPFSVADDWFLYKRFGIELKAFYPYMVDANLNMNILFSDVKQECWRCNRKQMSFKETIFSYYSAIIRRFLKYLGLYESKYIVMNGKVIGK